MRTDQRDRYTRSAPTRRPRALLRRKNICLVLHVRTVSPAYTFRARLEIAAGLQNRRASCRARFSASPHGDPERVALRVLKLNSSARSHFSDRLVSRHRGSRHNSRAGHPGWLRCSALKYSRYSRASRLAIRAPRSGTYATIHGDGTLGNLQPVQPTPPNPGSSVRPDRPPVHQSNNPK